MVYRLGCYEVNLFELGIIKKQHSLKTGLFGGFNQFSSFHALVGSPFLAVRHVPST